MNIHDRTRRNLLKVMGAGAAAMAIPSGLFSCAASAKKPNILFIFTDDQRFDTIHALGNEHIRTPNLDSLVHNGTTFSNAYIMGGTSPAVCMPSRAMMMTGRTLFHLQGDGWTIPREHVTLPEALRQAGYTTFQTGKWHQDRQSFARSFSAGARIMGAWPVELALVRYKGWLEGLHWNVNVYDFDPTGKYPKEKAYIAGGPSGSLRFPVDKAVKDGVHSSELFSNAAIRFLRDYKDDKPFFMYVSHMAPHDPRTAPVEYHEMYDPDKIPLPENFMPEHPFDNGELKVRDERLAPWPRTPEVIRRHLADYYAIITHVDAQIGRVLTALKETEHADNTIIVFSGDNGLALGQHGLMGKQNVYEHSVGVPLIISGTGIPKGEKRDTFCYLQDIFPTLCDLTGVPIPGSVEGKSLVPAIRNPNRKIRNTLHFAYMDYQRSVRDERYKLIEYVVKGKQTTQLFDMQADPWEMNNLADDPAYSEHLQRLRKELLKWKDEMGDSSQSFWRGFAKR